MKKETYLLIISGITFNAKLLKTKNVFIEAKDEKEFDEEQMKAVKEFIGKRKNIKSLWVRVYKHCSTQQHRIYREKWREKV